MYGGADRDTRGVVTALAHATLLKLSVRSRQVSQRSRLAVTAGGSREHSAASQSSAGTTESDMTKGRAGRSKLGKNKTKQKFNTDRLRHQPQMKYLIFYILRVTASKGSQCGLL